MTRSVGGGYYWGMEKMSNTQSPQENENRVESLDVQHTKGFIEELPYIQKFIDKLHAQYPKNDKLKLQVGFDGGIELNTGGGLVSKGKNILEDVDDKEYFTKIYHLYQEIVTKGGTYARFHATSEGEKVSLAELDSEFNDIGKRLQERLDNKTIN